MEWMVVQRGCSRDMDDHWYAGRHGMSCPRMDGWLHRCHWSHDRRGRTSSCSSWSLWRIYTLHNGVRFSTSIWCWVLRAREKWWRRASADSSPLTDRLEIDTSEKPLIPGDHKGLQAHPPLGVVRGPWHPDGDNHHGERSNRCGACAQGRYDVSRLASSQWPWRSRGRHGFWSGWWSVFVCCRFPRHETPPLFVCHAHCQGLTFSPPPLPLGNPGRGGTLHCCSASRRGFLTSGCSLIGCDPRVQGALIGVTSGLGVTSCDVMWRHHPCYANFFRLSDWSIWVTWAKCCNLIGYLVG